jgi:hypothetical protein
MSHFDKYTRLIAVCLVIGFFVRLSITFGPIDTLTDRYLADDFFYYLNIAYHLANGHGSTFDGGISYTNGYNPLLTGLLTVPFFLGASKTAAIRVGLLIQAVSVLAAAGLAARHCIRQNAWRGALLVAGVMSFGPFFLWPTLTGFETGLAVATAFVALDLWDRGRSAYWVGVACGVAFLARVDAVAVVAILLLVCAYKRQWRTALVLGVSFLTVILPFCLWSLRKFGIILPGSAIQKAHLRSFASIVHSLGTFISTLPYVIVPEGMTGRLPRSLSSVLAGVTALICVMGMSRLRLPRSLLLILVVAGYAAIADGFEPGSLRRYFFEAWVLSLMSVALAIEDGSGRWFSTGTRTAVPSLLVALVLLAHLIECARFVVWNRAAPPLSSYVGACSRLARVLDTYVSYDERIGSFDSGSLGYFSTRPVVNLDGLVNHDIMGVRQGCRGEPYEACLVRYLHEKRIAVLVGGTAFGWTGTLADWTTWTKLYESPPLIDGSHVVVLRVPQ